MTAAPSPRARRATRTATMPRTAKPLTTADAPARHLTEAPLRNRIKQLLDLGRWRWAYFPDSRWLKGHKGVPDIIAVRRDRLVFIETKRETGATTPEQEAWGADLLAVADVEYYVWRPSDQDEIESVLR